MLTFCYNLEVVLEIRFNITWNFNWVYSIFWISQTVFDQLWYMLIDTIRCCYIFTLYISNASGSILNKCPSNQSRLWVWNNWNCYVESTLFICYCNCNIQNNGTSWMTFKKYMNNKVHQLIIILMVKGIYLTEK